jgi:hypothetical protein
MTSHNCWKRNSDSARLKSETNLAKRNCEYPKEGDDERDSECSEFMIRLDRAVVAALKLPDVARIQVTRLVGEFAARVKMLCISCTPCGNVILPWTSQRKVGMMKALCESWSFRDNASPRD